MGQQCGRKEVADPRAPPTEESTVILDVGGHVFKVASTLLKNSGSPVLREVLAKGPSIGEEYFLDRDGTHYRYIFEFLRCGHDMLFPLIASARSELAHECLFLGLFELAARLKEKNSFFSPSEHTVLEGIVTAPAIDGACDADYRGAPLPANEVDRLSRLEGLKILQSSRTDARLDNATRIVAALFDAPIALVSIVYDDQQWFKSRVGLEDCFTDRRSSFCAHMFIPESPSDASMLVVDDCLADPRFMNNPLVMGDKEFRYYAGSPLVTSDGLRLGALCVIDRVPRRTTPALAQCLVNFSCIASQEVEREELMSVGANVPASLRGGAPPTTMDFAAGPHRRERMRAALSEAVLLVKVRSDSLRWPVLFANEGWSQLTSINVVSPSTLSGEVVASGPGLAGLAQGLTSCTNPMLWDWLQLSPSDYQQLTEKIKDISIHDDLNMFHVNATMPKWCQHIPGFEQMQVSCRFSPIDMPLDVNAAVIRAVPEKPTGLKTIDRAQVCTELYYFVTMSFEARLGEPIHSEGIDLAILKAESMSETTDARHVPSKRLFVGDVDFALIVDQVRDIVDPKHLEREHLDVQNIYERSTTTKAEQTMSFASDLRSIESLHVLA